jgi:GNAT superfamily N-acetyltransferase
MIHSLILQSLNSPSTFPANIYIKKAVRADIPAVQDLAYDFHQSEIEPRLSAASIFNPKSPYFCEGKQYFEDMIQAPSCICFIAKQQKDPIGYLTGRTRDEKETELEHLFVQQEQRRNRIGTSLVLAFIQWSKAHGARSILVEAYPPRKSNGCFYKSLGFTSFRVPGRKSLFFAYTIPS